MRLTGLTVWEPRHAAVETVNGGGAAVLRNLNPLCAVRGCHARGWYGGYCIAHHRLADSAKKQEAMETPKNDEGDEEVDVQELEQKEAAQKPRTPLVRRQVDRERFLAVIAKAKSNIEAAEELGLTDAGVAGRCKALGVETPSQRHGRGMMQRRLTEAVPDAADDMANSPDMTGDLEYPPQRGVGHEEQAPAASPFRPTVVTGGVGAGNGQPHAEPHPASAAPQPPQVPPAVAQQLADPLMATGLILGALGRLERDERVRVWLGVGVVLGQLSVGGGDQ